MVKIGTLKFVRVDRDCPANDQVREKGLPLTRLIRDYNVVSDGVHIATWKRNVRHPGYYLADATGFPVNPSGSRVNGSRAIDVSAKRDFEERTRELAHLIPSAEDLAQRAIEEERAEARRVAQEEEGARLRKVEEAAPKMLQALRAALPALELYHAYGWIDRDGVRALVRAAIEEAS